MNETSKRRRQRGISLAPIVMGAAAAAAVAVSIAVTAMPAQPEPDTGSYIISQGSMSDEQAQAMIDEQAEASRITVSLAPQMRLSEDGSLRVNLIVPEPNNGLSERLEVEQEGRIVYASGVVEPGYALEYGNASSAHAGQATATVYAVDSNGSDFGNPVSVEVEVVD